MCVNDFGKYISAHATTLTRAAMSDSPKEELAFEGSPDLKEDFDFRSALYLNPMDSDVSVVVQSGQQSFAFPAHSLVLSVTSDVFDKMLKSPLRESRNKEIIVKNVNPLIVESVLRYIYQGKINFENWQEASEALALAHMYNIKGLIKKCETFLTGSMNLLNICTILEAAVLYDLDELREQCTVLCGKAAFVVLKTKAFGMLQEEVVHSILRLPYLNVESEWAVFNSLWNWSTLSCCRKKLAPTDKNVLDEFRQFASYIRFSQLTKTERDKFPKSVLNLYSEQDDRYGLPNCWFPSSTPTGYRNRHKKRKLTFYRDLMKYAVVLELKHQNPATCCYFEDRDLTAIKFSVDHHAYMLEFVLLAVFYEYPELIKISWESSGQTGGLNYFLRKEQFVWKHISTLCDGASVKEARVIVKTPLLLAAGCQYYLDICCPYGNSIRWPRSNRMNDFSKNGFTVSILSDPCYGISSISFMPIPSI